MKALFVLVVLAAFIAGCGSKPDEAPAPIKSTMSGPPGAAANNAPQSGGIAPIGPNVGGITPVAGGENLGDGTGGGIGQAAKNRAKAAAEQQSGGPSNDDASGQ